MIGAIVLVWETVMGPFLVVQTKCFKIHLWKKLEPYGQSLMMEGGVYSFIL